MQRIDTSNFKIAVATLIWFSLFLFPHGVGEELPAPVAVEPPVVVSVVPKEKPRYGQNLVNGELPDVLKKIRWCESKNQQFNPDGSVHRGVINPQDVGWFQVNEYYHLEASQKAGIDIYTKEGNLAYALILYGRNGTRDWNWSKWCWDDPAVSTSTWEIRFKQNL